MGRWRPQPAYVVATLIFLTTSGVAALIRRYDVHRFLLVYVLTMGGMVVLSCIAILLYSAFGHLPDKLTHLTLGSYSLLYPAQLSLLILTVTEIGAWKYPLSVISLWLPFSFFVQVFALIRPRLRSPLFNFMISYPATLSFFASLAGLPFLPAYWLPYPANVLVGYGLPHILGLVGIIQSCLPVPSKWTRTKVTAGPGCESVSSEPCRIPFSGNECALKVVQLTDMHLGPFMSEERLQEVCMSAMNQDPDLILLTGDYHTPESDRTAGSLERGLRPLKDCPIPCFASLGNHDVETQEVEDGVRHALNGLGIRLLVNEVSRISLRNGREVEIVGHGWPHRVHTVCRSLVRVPDCCRIHLLHDPGCFAQICDEGSLSISGHTHGGQVGLVSLGLNPTLVGVMTGHPDHSLWAAERNRLHVHRGQGFRSLSCTWVPRLGVPPEYSVLHIDWLPRRDASPKLS
eukprot:TRINITY_DN538_c1_g2_i1.p1 TRINITY_DN538_c1_g2~~TRINITY_DN538_c1_g2_i1.p1  ORF type:complete len:459 (+),score=34.51 TRINITY_DN538_c1_g2_i1:299-1675(+)